jgi:hypothetical protein
VYDDLKSKNFEIISVAEDTGGLAAAAPWYDRAKATYTTLVDPTHKVSSLYNLVNVPSAVWVDEQGRVLRINEGTYSRTMPIGNNAVIGTDDYTPAVYDWVAKGPASPYVWSPEQVAAKIRRRTSDEALAEPTFKLGVYFFQRQDQDRARMHWKRAEELYPDSWNFHRQDWTFTAEGSGGKSFQEKRRALGEKPYYAPLELPPAPATPQAGQPGATSSPQTNPLR